MIKKNLLLSLSTGILGGMTAHAEWQLVQNFESEDPETLLTWNSNADGLWGTPYIVEPPDAPEAEPYNNVFFSDPEHSGEALAIIYNKWTLPGSGIEQGTTGTLYFRWYQKGPDHNVNVGLSDIAPDPDAAEKRPTAGAMAYGDFETQVLFDNRVTTDGQGYFAVRDAGSFVDTEVLRPDGEWIHVWVVVNNRNEDGVSVIDDSSLYFATGDGSNPMLVPIPDGSGGSFDSFLFRNQTSDPLVAFYVAAFNDTGIAGATPNPNEQWYIDNVQIDYAGENFTVPVNDIVGEKWAGFPVNGDGWADTGEFMGWLYVGNDPWIYSADLQKYVWLLEEYVSETGAWTYVPR